MRYKNNIIQEDMESIRNSKLKFDEFRNKRILITGASGMLASYFVYFFMYLNDVDDYGIKVYALVRNEKKAWEKFKDFEDNANFKLVVQDVCERLNVDTVIDYIIHAAGNASPYAILNDPVGIIKANTMGTINVMELARKSKAKVLYMSTREVYGKVSETIKNITENDFGVLDPTERRACYPESKRVAESIIQSYSYQYAVKSVIVRIAHSYGPGMIIDNDGRVMADFISDIVHSRNIVLKSKGDMERAFCYITDAISAMLFVLLKGEDREVYNVANETEPYLIRDVAEKLVTLFPEKGLQVVYDIPEEMSLGYSKMGRTRLNTSKIERLGWRPQIALEEGLKKTVLSFEDQQKEI